MLYRRNNEPTSRPRPLRGVLVALLCAVGVVAVAGGSIAWKKVSLTSLAACKSVDDDLIQRQRLQRSAIPPLNVRTMVYRNLFDDDNDTQLEAAVRNGVHDFESIEDPTCCSELVRIESNELYVVDAMQYSVPYLVPEAKLLLQRIAERFQEVMQEQYPNNPHTYRIVVTSCFRTPEQVQRLMRRNRNASENSCHRYGTTMDISHIRWITEQNDTVNELYLKQMLAKTLYELRYEGLCWVKYERRQACFHLTLRHTEYLGDLPQVAEYRNREDFAPLPQQETIAQNPSVQQDAGAQLTSKKVKDKPKEDLSRQATKKMEAENYLEYL